MDRSGFCEPHLEVKARVSPLGSPFVMNLLAPLVRRMFAFAYGENQFMLLLGLPYVPLFSWQIPLFALLKQKSFITGVQTLLYVRQETMSFGVISKKKVKTCSDARFV